MKTTKSSGKFPARRMKPLPQVIAAHYICDFRYLVLGHSGQRTVTVHNMFHEAVSFTINRKELALQGFTVQPEQVISQLDLAQNVVITSYTAANLPTISSYTMAQEIRDQMDLGEQTEKSKVREEEPIAKS